MRDETRDVAGHQLGAERSIDVGRPAVPLQVDADDLPALRQRRKVGAEHLGRTETAVQEDQRPTTSVNLVVELDAIDVRVRHVSRTRSV